MLIFLKPEPLKLGQGPPWHGALSEARASNSSRCAHRLELLLGFLADVVSAPVSPFLPFSTLFCTYTCFFCVLFYAVLPLLCPSFCMFLPIFIFLCSFSASFFCAVLPSSTLFNPYCHFRGSKISVSQSRSSHKSWFPLFCVFD